MTPCGMKCPIRPIKEERENLPLWRFGGPLPFGSGPAINPHFPALRSLKGDLKLPSPKSKFLAAIVDEYH
jgi:hypothetical protein